MEWAWLGEYDLMNSNGVMGRNYQAKYQDQLFAA